MCGGVGVWGCVWGGGVIACFILFCFAFFYMYVFLSSFLHLFARGRGGNLCSTALQLVVFRKILTSVMLTFHKALTSVMLTFLKS